MAIGLLLLLLLLLSLVAAHRQPPGSTSRAAWPAPDRIRLLLAEDQDPHITLTSSLQSLTANGQIATVTIADRSGARRTAEQRRAHLLALYTYPSDARSVLPITFLNVSLASPGYPSTGAATVPIKLLNMHSPGFVLRLIRNGTTQPVVEAESGMVANAVRDAPGQLHLAQHADGRSLVVQWVSASPLPQQLVYGPQGGAKGGGGGGRALPEKRVASSARTYAASQLCGPPANSFGFISPGYMHAAVIPGEDVGPDAQLRYRVGSDAVGWAPGRAATGPSPADVAAGRRGFTFLVFNDVGQENAVLFDNVCPPYCPAGWQWEAYTANSTKLLRHLLAEEDAQLGLLIGDVSYANGVQADWDYFGHQFEPAFSRWPLATAAGNHERGPEAGGECNVPYTYRYYTPAWHAGERASRTAATAPRAAAAAGLPERPDVATSFYSFDMSGVHFLMLDSEAPSDPGSPQGLFVAADLAKVDRRRTPWLVVGVHKQVVGPTTNPDNVRAQARLQADFEELFMRHKVDLVLQGHDHAYARTCPVYKGRCVGSATPAPARHAASGAAVAAERAPTQDAAAAPAAGSRRRSGGGGGGGAVQTLVDPGAPIYILAGHAGAGFTHAFPDPLPEWVAFGAQDRNGYVRVTVRGGRLTAVSVSTDDGSVMDGVEVVRTLRQDTS